ncbi:MAG: non-reducing end alpha-L-arabinofuranosidase family hydrolase [Polyangiaceae bacterium]
MTPRNTAPARRTLRSALCRTPSAFALALFASAVACSGSDGTSESGTVGGTASTMGGGAGASTGGASGATVPQTKPSVGGTPASAGSSASGGSSAAAGSSAVTQTGGVASMGGTTAAAGSSASGGTTAVGGTTAKGGTTAAGGTTAKGGSTGTGGGTYCPLPAKFKWTTSAALAKVPRTIDGHNVIAIKDFTHVVHNNKHVVYATAYEGNWKSAMFVFDDWSNWDATAGTWFPRNAVAPTLIYFTPKKQWVLFYQWGFQYATSSDPTNASSWSTGKSLLSNGPSSAIDQTFICDSTNCYLFFAGDNGNIYRSSMPIGNFPSTFNGYQTIMTDTQAKLFEAVQVYTVKGPTPQYLMIVEAMGGGGRYFRAFTATDLGGKWTAMPGAETEASPFAGKANVTGTLWSNDVSHGDLVRIDPSETQPIDPCNLQLLYQGFDKTKSASGYGTIPYQPGLLTLVR